MPENNTQKFSNQARIFIVGMARSGTTLLSEIINRHSQIAVSPETHYFRKYWVNMNNGNLKKRIKLAEKFLDSNEFKQFKFSTNETKKIRKEAYGVLKNGQPEILDIVLTNYRLKLKKQFWCEKTPVHLLFLPQILKLFSTSKFICLVRDPRDICLSLKSVPFNVGSTISIARRWKLYSKRLSVYRNEFKKKLLITKYEDLINNPENEIKTICKFIGIDYEGKMLNRSRIPSTFDGEKEYWKLNAIKPVDKNNHGKWQQYMKPGEIYFLQKFLSKEMNHYKYVHQPTKFGLNVFVQLIIITAHWPFTIFLTSALRIFGIFRYND